MVSCLTGNQFDPASFGIFSLL
ncbi:BnaC05g02720D [Brassica napus]|uniref:BnaC05g02720D protein n=1 Tax=Brassica napus TaxID=3708 RepID=A0A078FYK4_BRANA|nr:BnaC05g02720D [Brassica napus]